MGRSKLALVVFLGGLTACSGRYVRGTGNETGSSGDGDRGGAGTTGSDGASAVAGASPGTAGSGAGATDGRSDPARPLPTDLSTQCGLSQEEWRGAQLAPPEEIWRRLSPLIWGEQHETPEEFEGTSPPGVWKTVEAALAQAVGETGGTPGASWFVTRWLRLDPKPTTLSFDWAAFLRGGAPALEVLLGAEIDQHRVSAFAERKFLQKYPTSPKRGQVMFEAIFGVLVPPPPQGITQQLELLPGMTRRESLEKQVSDPACASCHHLFDPFGYSLANYDEKGSFITEDAGKPIDASGKIEQTTASELRASIEFQSIADLGPQLAGECAANLGLANEFLDIAVSEMSSGDPFALLTDEDYRIMRSAYLRSDRSYGALVMAFAHTRVALAPLP